MPQIQMFSNEATLITYNWIMSDDWFMQMIKGQSAEFIEKMITKWCNERRKGYKKEFALLDELDPMGATLSSIHYDELATELK